MSQLRSQLNARSADFQINAQAMRALVDDLRAQTAKIAEGGGEAARAKGDFAALVGLIGGVLLTTVAGARRSSTAYERFRQDTLASDLDIAFDGPPTEDIDAAKAVGKLLAERAVKNGVKEVVFDRGGYLYHGRVKALGDAARESGLSF